MGMSRIRLSIDRLVLNGFLPLEAKALTGALQSRLSEVLSEQAGKGEQEQSRRIPDWKLDRMPIEAGTNGASKFGRRLGQAVGQRLKQ